MHTLKNHREEKFLHVPSGTATANPVLTSAFPLAGTTHLAAAYRSYPAAKADPRVGAFAVEESFLISSGGVAEIGATAGVLDIKVDVDAGVGEVESLVGTVVEDMVCAGELRMEVGREGEECLGRLASGEEGAEGG